MGGNPVSALTTFSVKIIFLIDIASQKDLACLDVVIDPNIKLQVYFMSG